jgi:hypothetical protein
MIRHLARVAAVAILAAAGLVACGDDQQACAAPAQFAVPAVYNPPKPQQKANPPKVNQPRPQSQRTTSRVQDQPRANKTTTKPTTWAGYNDRVKQRNWSQPYRKDYPVAPQPVIINQYGHDYRTYPGYGGYYPIGVWPAGYGQRYGCVADQEGDGEKSPTPAPTMTVTVTPTPSPSSTPTETPRG